MATRTSPVTQQTECIYLTVDENDFDVSSILVEAKELATREGKMVMFAIATYGKLLQVTSDSDIEDMLAKYFDRYNCQSIIA